MSDRLSVFDDNEEICAGVEDIKNMLPHDSKYWLAESVVQMRAMYDELKIALSLIDRLETKITKLESK